MILCIFEALLSNVCYSMIPVLGIPLYNKTIEIVVDDILHSLSVSSEKKNLRISATGAHGLVEASKNPGFKKTLEHFFINLPDGMPAVWVGRIKGANQMRRCYGPDFFKYLMLASSALPVKHFFCGGKEGVADELKTACSEQFQNQQVTGTFCPPFREMTDQEMVSLGEKITDSGAHIVWIGLSTPKQEVFAERLSHFTSTCYIITVGASFDFHTGKVKQAPKWMQSVGLEWFFRLIIEPKRLYKRYFEIVPMFIYLNIKEFLHFYINKRSHT